MKIGYPVINLGLGHISSHTFHLASLSPKRLFATIDENLSSLEKTLEWNAAHDLLFYRISSNIIPFASHASMDIDWQTPYARRLKSIGDYVIAHNMRISMHPGQFVVLNSPNKTTYDNSVRELTYHAEFMELLGLNNTHKIQFHMGGVHGDREASMQLFIERYTYLPENMRRRLVIENDERTASLQDCLAIHAKCGIPVLFDTLHHEITNKGETIVAGLKLAANTWHADDGLPMIDYSSQNPDKKVGAHAVTLDVDKFRRFIRSLKGFDVDIMFEIKNKEASALQAQIILSSL